MLVTIIIVVLIIIGLISNLTENKSFMANYYAQRCKSARDENNGEKAYEYATKIIKLEPSYEVSFCHRAMIVFTYLYYNKAKIREAIYDLRRIYNSGTFREDVIDAIQTCCSTCFQIDMKEHVANIEMLYDEFPTIRAEVCIPHGDFDYENVGTVNIIKNIIQKCTDYIDNYGECCSFIYITRANWLLQLYGIKELENVINDLIIAYKINSDSKFASIVRMECFIYLINIFKKSGNLNQYNNPRIEELVKIVLKDAEKIKSLPLGEYSDRAALLEQDLSNIYESYINEIQSNTTNDIDSNISVNNTQNNITNNKTSNLNSNVVNSLNHMIQSEIQKKYHKRDLDI